MPGSPWWWPFKEVPEYKDKDKLLLLNANKALPTSSNDSAVWMGYIAVSPAGKPLCIAEGSVKLESFAKHHERIFSNIQVAVWMGYVYVSFGPLGRLYLNELKYLKYDLLVVLVVWYLGG